VTRLEETEQDGGRDTGVRIREEGVSSRGNIRREKREERKKSEVGFQLVKNGGSSEGETEKDEGGLEWRWGECEKKMQGARKPEGDRDRGGGVFGWGWVATQGEIGRN
jgi:hypothetical protein